MTTTETFNEYFAPLTLSLRRVAIRLTGNDADADDLLADTQMRIWRAIESYDPERATPSAWAFTIMRNCWINEVGRRSRRTKVEHRWSKMPGNVDAFADNIAVEEKLDADRKRTEIDAVVREAIDELPEMWRDATLRVMQGQRHENIAVVQGTTANTIHSRTSRSRIVLRERLAHVRTMLEAIA